MLCTRNFSWYAFNIWSFGPKFWGRTRLLILINVQLHQLVLVHAKKNASPIFTVPFNYAKFGVDSGTVKIGAAAFFWVFKPNKAYPTLIYIQKLDRPPNMGAKIPPNKFPNAKTVLPKKHTWNWCALGNTVLGCQIRNIGGLPPILRRQSCPGTHKHKNYRMLMLKY